MCQLDLCWNPHGPRVCIFVRLSLSIFLKKKIKNENIYVFVCVLPLHIFNKLLVSFIFETKGVVIGNLH